MLLAALALLAAPVQAKAVDQDKAVAQASVHDREVLDALASMRAGQHDRALTLIRAAVAGFADAQAAEKRRIYCAFEPTETLLYLTTGAAAKQDTVAIDAGWCDALFAYGFILSDARRFDEALVPLGQAVAMAPSHAHYLNELGYVLQQQRRWQESYDAFQRAVGGASFAPERKRAEEKGRAWRGMSYALIEMGRWDEAQAVLEDCLKLDPNDAKAKNELQYIREKRPKPAKSV